MYPADTNNIKLFSNTRRRLLKSIPLLAMAPRFLGAQTDGDSRAAIPVSRLHSFEIRVSDPSASRAFYQDLFGMPVQSRYGERVCLRVGEGPHHMAIRRVRPGESPGITQIGYAVEDFNVDDLLAALQDLGYQRMDPPPPVSASGLENAMRCWVRGHGGADEVYFADERGLIVQLTAADYCGGRGPLGGECGMVEAAPSGMMELVDINHFTVFVGDGAAANAYYQEIFGLSVQTYQGPGSPVTGIGDGRQFVMYAGPPGAADMPANIHHACFSVRDFDVERIRAMLSDYGLEPRGDRETGPMMHYVSLRMPDRGGAEGGTAELYFTDPDGILMQLQDPTYCGGGGVLGEICEA